jgi:hypothetical protein
MVDRYATQQFYNFGSYEPDIGTFNNRTNKDNPRFIWPRPHITNAVVGEENENGRTNQAHKYRVQRGYMRMITDAYKEKGKANPFTELGKRRLHFQFNPETLTRIVTARNDIQMWQNQDPFQFTQPIPGDSNFSFELMFNREAEVSSAAYRNGDGQVVENNAVAQLKEARQFGGFGSDTMVTTFVDSPYDQSWVSDIGVLADIMVFDQIIGQGMNKDLINAIVKKAGEVTAAYNLALGDETKDGDDKEKKTFEATTAANFLGTNIGNSAFLIAQPIRIVFSSTFMVEGFITSTSVVFNKFNPRMVPTQCLISVQMQAMYIGFASKDTYLTKVFSEYDPNEAFSTTSETDSKIVTRLKAYGKDMFTKGGVAAPLSRSKYNLNAERIYTRDTDSESEILVDLFPSPTTKEFATSKFGTIVPSLQVTLTYLGRSNGALPPPVGGQPVTDFGLGEVVYRQIINAEPMKNPALQKSTISFKLKNPVNGLKPLWDRNDDAQYEVKVVLFFTIKSNEGATATAIEIATAKHEGGWRETWYFGDSLVFRGSSDAEIEKIRSESLIGL